MASDHATATITLPGTAFAHGQVTVTGAQTLRAANPKRRSIVGQNLGAGTLYVGASGVSSSDGLQVLSGGSFSLDSSASATIYVNNNGTNCDVRFVEELTN